MTAAELAHLHARAMSEARPWSADEFAALLAQASVHLSCNDFGFAIGRTVAAEAELLMLATVPEARRRGHARRHLARFEADARSRGAELAFLEVACDNAAARELYLRGGYVEVGRRPGYYRRANGLAAAALVMRKTLSDT